MRKFSLISYLRVTSTLPDPIKIEKGVCNEVQYLSLVFFEILWQIRRVGLVEIQEYQSL